MIDYQFLGMVAVVFAVITRGSLLPVLLMTAVVAVVMLAYEATARRLRRRPTNPAVAPGTDGPAPSDTDLTRWMSVMDRVLRSHD